MAMTFIITWTTSTGGAATARENSPVGALSNALVLLVRGYEDVVIFDEGGKGAAYTPDDFGKFFVDTRDCRLTDMQAKTSGNRYGAA
jgi:hypothetical protein